MRHLLALLLGIYLGSSPVYWLPGIDPAQLRSIKFLLIGATFVLIALYARKEFLAALTSRRFGIPMLALLLACAAPGFIQADSGEAIRSLLDYSFTFLTLWATFAFVKKTNLSVQVFSLAALVIAAFCTLTITSDVLGVPNLRAPAVYDHAPLGIAGFGAKRTGWSNGVALFLPLSMLLAGKHLNRLRFTHAVPVLAGVAIIGSQFVVAGRAGLLASLVALVGIGSLVLPKKQLIFAGMLLAILYAVLSPFILPDDHRVAADGRNDAVAEAASHLRFDRLESGGGNSLDRFSAGRVGQFACAIELAAESPLLGYGFGRGECLGAQIHNLWLKLLLEGGVFVPLSLLFFVVAMLALSLKIRRSLAESSAKESATHREALICMLVIVQGLIISMFEPNALIGSFQATAVWWAALGALMARSDAIGRLQYLPQQNRVPAARTAPFEILE